MFSKILSLVLNLYKKDHGQVKDLIKEWKLHWGL